ELDLDAAVFVGPDFLAGGANHAGRLRAVRARNRRDARGAVLDARRQRREGFFVEFLRAAASGIAAHAHAVVHRHDQVFAVLGLARMVAQREQVARRQAAGVAQPQVLFLDALQLFQPHPRVVFAVLGFLEAALPFEHFQVARLGSAGPLGNRIQAGARLGEIVVDRGIAVGRDLRRDLPHRHVFFWRSGNAVGPVIGNGFIPRHRRMQGDVVGHDQRVQALVVLEVIIDALVLHQAADEGEVGFLVLDAVFPRAVAAGELRLEGVAIFAQHFFDDVRDGLLLEDLVVGGLGQVPQPGFYRGLVDIVARRAAFAAYHDAAHDQPAEIARGGGGGDFQRERLAQQLLQVEVEVVRQQFDFEFKQLRQAFVAGHLLERQAVSQGSMRNDGTRLNEAWNIHGYSPETIFLR